MRRVDPKQGRKRKSAAIEREEIRGAGVRTLTNDHGESGTPRRSCRRRCSETTRLSSAWLRAVFGASSRLQAQPLTDHPRQHLKRERSEPNGRGESMGIVFPSRGVLGSTPQQQTEMGFAPTTAKPATVSKKWLNLLSKGAGNGIRTHDFNLGKVALYH